MKFGIITQYKTKEGKIIEFKSKLEARIAYFLDALNIKWEYEPKAFSLSGNTPYSEIIYIPDFYLPESKQWIEGKGIIDVGDEDFMKCKKLSNEYNCEVIIISPEKTIILESSYGPYIGEDVWLINCSHCNKISFCSMYGSYHCRCCKEHEGDHDLAKFNFKYKDGNISLGETFNFRSARELINSIKEAGGVNGERKDRFD